VRTAMSLQTAVRVTTPSAVARADVWRVDWRARSMMS
jgi:hypothetical protein